jgi:hypothetical protein
MDELNEWQRPHTPVPDELRGELVHGPGPAPAGGFWPFLRRLFCRHHWAPLGRGYAHVCRRCGKAKRMAAETRPASTHPSRVGPGILRSVLGKAYGASEHGK